MIKDLTSYPDYMDQEVVDKVIRLILKLTEMQDNLFDFVLESDDTFRTNLIISLENINRFGRLNGSEVTVDAVSTIVSDI